MVVRVHVPHTREDTESAWHLAERQLKLDQGRTARFPQLLARKLMRMSASPLAFLRGSAPLFYELLAEHPELAEGPAGEGWIVGDLHLENFGAYRPDPAGDEEEEERTLFDLNDFDDTTIGPWRFDVLRLATSVLLAGRETGASGVTSLALCDRMLEAWVGAAFAGRRPGTPPAPVSDLIEQVRSRSRRAFLDSRTRVSRGERRFVRGPRYANLAPSVASAVPAALAAYAANLAAVDRPKLSSLTVLDAAHRIAGTGSLGGLRIAALVRGKGTGDGSWIFDLKEQGTPAASVLVPPPDLLPAVRVATGFRACIARPPRLMGTTRLKSLSMFVRKLMPQEDKLNLRRLDGEHLPGVASYLGALLGAAHARGASKKPPARWSSSDLKGIRHQAVTLAGIHEAVYLALCEKMRGRLRGQPAKGS
jgi:uncharacterized protein (DUF2252 family)